MGQDSAWDYENFLKSKKLLSLQWPTIHLKSRLLGIWGVSGRGSSMLCHTISPQSWSWTQDLCTLQCIWHHHILQCQQRFSEIPWVGFQTRLWWLAVSSLSIQWLLPLQDITISLGKTETLVFHHYSSAYKCQVIILSHCIALECLVLKTDVWVADLSCTYIHICKYYLVKFDLGFGQKFQQFQKWP